LEASVFDQAAAEHSLAERRLEMGLFGLLGSNQNAPNHIAFIAMFLGIIVAVGCIFSSGHAADAQAKFLQGFAEKAFTFSSGCLGFIFGRSTAKS